MDTTAETWRLVANGLSGLGSIASVIVATVALLRTRDLESRRLVEGLAVSRRNLTIQIWETWLSPNYRGYRVEAWRQLHQASVAHQGGDAPRLAPILHDRACNEAVGSIEHFIDEVSMLMEEDLIEKALFEKLFRRSLLMWAGLLSMFDRTDSDAFTLEDLNLAFERLLGKNFEDEALAAYRSAGHPAR